MSLSRRIWEGAQSTLGKLSSLVIVDDEPLHHVEAADLTDEIAVRRAATTTPGMEDSLAKVAALAGASPTAKAARAAAARRWAATAEQRATDARAMGDAGDARASRGVGGPEGRRAGGDGASGNASRASTGASQGARGTSNAASTGSAAGKSGSTRASVEAEFERLRRAAAQGGTTERAAPRKTGPLDAYYKTLHLPPGATLAEVKTAYRQLMKRYHPDMHMGNAEKQKAATALSRTFSEAYEVLKAALEK